MTSLQRVSLQGRIYLSSMKSGNRVSGEEWRGVKGLFSEEYSQSRAVMSSQSKNPNMPNVL